MSYYFARKRAQILSIAPFVGASFVAILIALMPVHAASAIAFDGGDGTSGTPYLISTCDQLQGIASSSLSAYYALTGHIDCTGTPVWNGGAGFQPIGDATTKFTGNFNGNGYHIDGLQIARPTTPYAGLFGFVGSGGVVTKVGMTNANITGYQAVGTLVGLNWGAVSKSYAANSVVRGIYASGDGVGGLVGASPASAFGTGPGGVSVTNSYTLHVDVSGAYAVGGLVGDPWNGTVTNSYAIGAITHSTIYWGPLFGNSQNSGTISGNIWNADVQSSSGAYVTGGVGKTTAEMKTQSTFNAYSWDFAGTWTIDSSINEGYPYLQSSVMVLPDTTAPGVSITMPTDGMVVSGAGGITADASDNVAVAGVTFYINNVLQGSERTTAPYATPWYTNDFPSGAYTLIAVARDTSNNYATSTPITITVDHVAPILTLTSSDIGNTGAYLAWTTSKPASALVNYGTTSSYGFSTMLTDNSPYALSHVAALAGLSSCTSYHFQLSSFDAVGNTGTTTDSTFVTAGCPVVIRSSGSAPMTAVSSSGSYAQAGQAVTTAANANAASNIPASISALTNHAAQPAAARDLKKGMTGTDVRSLQQLLIAANSGPAAQALSRNGMTAYFGARTSAALAEYQQAHKIAPAIGYFGSTTRSTMKSSGISGLWW